MRRPDALAAMLSRPLDLERADAPTIYVGLHLGSPVLGYLALCRHLVPDLALIARGIDPANPMPEAKKRFAIAKVAWTEAQAGRPFYETDGAAMLGVRRHLRAGHPLYMLADVPGDAVGRSAPSVLFGEAVRLASGLPTLARIAGSAIQTLVVTRDHAGLAVRAGARLAPEEVTMPAVLDALAPFIRSHPEQWWMWPYLPPAFDSAGS
jgi:lauroyl/myristoyl acyltransferase